LQATNDRSSRAARGEALQFVIERANQAPLFPSA
jgi:hypothetical protein